MPLDVKAGDTVLFGKWSGTEVKIDGEDLLIMKEADIMGIVEKSERPNRSSRRTSSRQGVKPRRPPDRPASKLPANRSLLQDRTGRKHVCQGNQILQRRPRPHAARRRDPQQRRQGDARPQGPQRHHRQAPTARRASPRTASPSPRKSSLPTSSRTWARRWCAKWPRRPTISPATAPPPRPCWPPRSCAKAPSWSPPA